MHRLTYKKIEEFKRRKERKEKIKEIIKLIIFVIIWFWAMIMGGGTFPF